MGALETMLTWLICFPHLFQWCWLALRDFPRVIGDGKRTIMKINGAGSEAIEAWDLGTDGVVGFGAPAPAATAATALDCLVSIVEMNARPAAMGSP